MAGSAGPVTNRATVHRAAPNPSFGNPPATFANP